MWFAYKDWMTLMLLWTCCFITMGEGNLKLHRVSLYYIAIISAEDDK